MVEHLQLNEFNMSHQLNKEQKHIFITIDKEKVFDKILQPLIIKIINKLETEGTYLKIIKAI